MKHRLNKSQPSDNQTPVNIIDQISNFVEKIRIETSRNSPGVAKVRRRQEVDHQEPSTSTGNGAVAAQASLAKKHAEDLVIQAEQYKAAVQSPTGNELFNISMGPNNIIEPTLTIGKVAGVPAASEDDEFFHLTCHVEPNLRQKIEQGGFVDLEKLLPKGRSISQRFTEDNKMQLVNRDGGSFWIPAEREKVNSLKRWDQAFRIYAAICSRANPQRAHEIWQYIHIITTAAASYIWDNVSEYDITFRQLMSTYLHRSWAKIYTQMWNLAMQDPIHRHYGKHSGGNYNSNNQKEGHDRYCWKFNKNKCKSRSCDWEH